MDGHGAAPDLGRRGPADVAGAPRGPVGKLAAVWALRAAVGVSRRRSALGAAGLGVVFNHVHEKGVLPVHVEYFCYQAQKIILSLYR